jgi:hypothetical protein
MPALIRKIGILFVLIVLLAVPAMAGTQYMAGSPELSASISGTNEFNPGDDVNLAVIIQNTGLNEFQFVQSGLVDPDDLPNTAKFLTVTLQPGDAPLVIKSDPQMVGDLQGSNSVNAVFSVKINSDAVAGIYNLPLEFNYTYLYSAYQYGTQTLQYSYKQKLVNVTLPIKIKPVISIAVLSAIPDQVNVGTEGHLNMKIQNIGSEDGTNAVVKLLQNGNSPIIPTDNSVYIGDFPAGSVVDCNYRIKVSSEGDQQTYPVDVVVVYKNDEGDYVTSRSETIGVPVGGKINFTVISPPAVMSPGDTDVIKVEYQNSGDSTIYDAEARISALDPFTSDDNIAYLGELKPGESAVGSYEITVDRSASFKEYDIDSEIQYRDALENTYISDPLKVNINIVPVVGFVGILINPVYLAAIIAVLICGIYLVLRIRKKSN